MEEQQLQSLTEEISETFFGLPFLHHISFNARLRTTGGRYLLRTHNIEINPHHYRKHGLESMIGTIKHELCHYHLHLQKRGYRHQDRDFQELLARVGGSRYCPDTGLRREVKTRYEYVCTACGQEYQRKRKIDLDRFGCGRCRGKIKLLRTFLQQDRN
ncbi:SprT family protein [Tumebacillus lipolyticus]|uniref:Protein SprT-like n=1 Tax=Tumebacillus lipolyticus TaxID=1280370 RepID=A0ABW4ZTY6_9BACL